MLAPLLAVVVLAQDAPTSTDKAPLHAARQVRAQGNTVAVDPLGRGTWVVDADLNQVELLRPGENPVVVKTGRWPEQLVVDSFGRVYVTCREDSQVVRIESDFHLTPIETGAEPSGLYLDEPSGRLWVGLVTERALMLIDTRTLRRLRERPVGFEPGPLQLTKDGLAVLSRQGGQLLFSAPSLDESEDWVVQLPEQGMRRAWRGEALAKVRDDLLVVHTEIDSGLSRPATGGSYGGGGASSLPIATVVTVVRDGRVAQQLGIPSLSDVTSVAVSGSQVAFASRGNAMVVLADFPAGLQRISRLATLFAGEGLSGVTFESDSRVLAFASFDRTVLTLEPRPSATPSDGQTTAEKTLSSRARTQYPGATVRIGRNASSAEGLNTAFAATAFGDGQRLAVAEYEDLPEAELDADVVRGRRLFFDATDSRVSTSGLACVSCHPDGRQDGVVWKLNGSRRQTMLLAGRLADTAPYNWKGSTHSLEDNIAQTTQRLGGRGLPKEEQRVLARFLVAGLRPVTLPRTADTALVERGKVLFHDEVVGCASCHPSEGAFADGDTHDVESVRKGEQEELEVQALRQKDAALSESLNAGLGNVFGAGSLNSFGLGGLGLRGTGNVSFAGPTTAKPHSRRAPVALSREQRIALQRRIGHSATLPAAALPVAEKPVAPEDHSFDTPSLRSLAVSAPYMHDGAYATLESLLEQNHDRMGATSDLSEADRAALAAYLRSL